MQTVYEAVGGQEGLLRLASAWHARLKSDEVVSHAFGQGFDPIIGSAWPRTGVRHWAGPNYLAGYGSETSVVRTHSGNGSLEEMDLRAIDCFDQALTDVALSEGDPVHAVLHDYFAWATTTSMSRYHHSADHVPQGLSIPQWSWDGLQGSAPMPAG